MAKRQLTTEEFIEKATEIHGDKYDYSKVNYSGTENKVCIICHKHGEFNITPHHHLRGVGCPKCSGRYKTTEEWIEEAKKVHGDRYDYLKSEYKNSTEKICIICPKHGEFWQRPCDHLNGYGCPKCRSLRSNTEDFIKKAILVHGDRYYYNNVKYNGCRNDVEIICKKHGVFKQKPFKHLQGHGCPICNSSHLEEKVCNVLKNKKIIFEYQCGKKTFNWLGLQTLDFYLPEYNVAIECQGEQHYEPIDFAGKGKEWAEKQFSENVKRDKTKKEKCEKNKIEILYVNKNNFENVINKWLGVNSLA